MFNSARGALVRSVCRDLLFAGEDVVSFSKIPSALYFSLRKVEELMTILSSSRVSVSRVSLRRSPCC
jgi:hypothetical protein